ncbi:MAG TPA: bL35 family ribosomal protein [Candidatus Gracilibacteria bacterium]|nr:50S ribosomal protein L35 [Candidatus Gracilibacteria bacterium]HRY91717.1 bL35 family ribosomal protein [Candidatus Gracilibacteria bacterium]
MKLKSHSATKKRVKMTGTGKVLLQKSAKKHLLAQKSKRQKKLFKGGKPTTLTNSKNIKKVLPYGN